MFKETIPFCLLKSCRNREEMVRGEEMVLADNEEMDKLDRDKFFA